MTYVVSLAGGYEVSDDRSRLDLNMIHAFLAEAYWANSRSRAATDRAIAHCVCFGLYGPDGAQAGFARVLSDYALRAHLADVFVTEMYRGRGLGRALVAAVLNHPDLRDVGTWSLTTRDAHRLYASFGFVQIANPESQMSMQRSLFATCCERPHMPG